MAGSILCVRADDRWWRAPRYAGSRAELLCDPNTPVKNLRAGIVAVDPGVIVPLHYHKVDTLEYVMSGQATISDRDGNVIDVGPGDTMLFGAGPEGAHRWDVIGNLPALVMFAYPTPGGEDDEITWLESQPHPSRGESPVRPQ